MNRLSFLKSVGFGVSAAIITPKILIEENTPQKFISSSMEYNKEKTLLPYEHGDSVLGNTKVCLWDNVLGEGDGRGAIYVVTGLSENKVELTSIDSETKPNYVEVDYEHFHEYFVVIGNTFKGKLSY